MTGVVMSDYSVLIMFVTTFTSTIFATGQETGQYIFATDTVKQKIYQISLDNGNMTNAFDIGVVVPGIYYDQITRNLYWTDYSGKQIIRAPLHNLELRTSFKTGRGMPERIVMDASTGHLYYTAAVVKSKYNNESFIAVLDPEGRGHKTLITGLDRPRAIVLYPSKGLMFWTDYGRDTSHIGRGYMDGSEWSFLYTHSTNPHGLAIDYKENRLYWSDAYLNHIVSTDLEGNNLKVLLTDEGAYIEDIMIREPFLYYTTDKAEKIVKIVKTTGAKIPWINMTATATFGRLQGLALTTNDDQPVNVWCKDGNGLCSTFCLPRPNLYRCACPNSMPMSHDGATCKGVTRCPLHIPNGKLATTCLGFPDNYCDYTCHNGFLKPSYIRRVVCLKDGKWSIPVHSFCKVDEAYLEPAVSIRIAGAIGGASLVISVITVIILTVYICVISKRKASSIERIDTSTTLGLGLNDPGDANHAFENNVYSLEFNEEINEQAKQVTQ